MDWPTFYGLDSSAAISFPLLRVELELCNLIRQFSFMASHEIINSPVVVSFRLVSRALSLGCRSRRETPD